MRARWIASFLVVVGLARPTSADDALFPPELVRFRPYTENPVFTSGGEGDWDERIRERGWILRDGDRYHLWYTGYDGTREGQRKLGYATSSDGLRWERHPDNPIHDMEWVEDMMVVPHEGTYHMFAEGRGDQAHLLTSADGIRWVRQGPLDVRRTDGTPIEAGPYGTPTAWHEHGVWYLFYERRDAGVWLAKSEDLKVWVNVQDEPVLTPGPDEFDRDLIALNQIVRHGDRYYAYFHGASASRSPRLWATGIATSTDLIHWTKYEGNPLVPVEANKSSGIVLPDGDTFRFYTMHDRVDVWPPAANSGVGSPAEESEP